MFTAPECGTCTARVPGIHRAKTKLLPGSCHTVFISASVIIHMSISKSHTEFFEHRHYLIYLCVMRAQLSPQQGIGANVLRKGRDPLLGGFSRPGWTESQIVCCRDEVNVGRAPGRDALALLCSDSIRHSLANAWKWPKKDTIIGSDP